MGIHELDTQHNDFEARNTAVDNVKNPRWIVIVGFTIAKNCSCRRRCDLRLYQYSADRGEFLCEEPYNIATTALIWTPSKLYFIRIQRVGFVYYSSKYSPLQQKISVAQG